jgi:hypothetical protein
VGRGKAEARPGYACRTSRPTPPYLVTSEMPMHSRHVSSAALDCWERRAHARTFTRACTGRVRKRRGVWSYGGQETQASLPPMSQVHAHTHTHTHTFRLLSMGVGSPGSCGGGGVGAGGSDGGASIATLHLHTHAHAHTHTHIHTHTHCSVGRTKGGPRGAWWAGESLRPCGCGYCAPNLRLTHCGRRGGQPWGGWA